MSNVQKLHNANVLFVDDEPRVLTSMRAMFRRDYNVLLANSGQEAIDILKQHRIQVIVSDQRMPGMTGIEVLNQVKEIAPAAVRILLTGYADLDAIEASINESEVFRYLTKPCSRQELKDVIRLATEVSRHPETLVDETAATSDSALSLVTSQAISVQPADLPPPDSYVAPERTVATGKARNIPLHKSLIAEVDRNVELLLLSRDQQLIDGLKTVLSDSRKLHIAYSVSAAIDILEDNAVGVLVTDTAIDEDAVQNLTAELKRHVPQLVTIIASDRSDAQTLISLINYGQIFRFLLKPIQGGQCRLWIQSAVKKHLELVSLPSAEKNYQGDNNHEEGAAVCLMSKLRSGLQKIGKHIKSLKPRRLDSSGH